MGDFVGDDRLEPRRRARRTLVALGVVAPLIALALSVGSVLQPANAQTLTGFTIFPTIPPSTTTTKPKPKPPMPERTWLATPRSSIPTYDAPSGRQIGSVGRWYGYSITVPIVRRSGSWLLVRLPERPNNSTAWVRVSDVAISSTAYRILIRRSHTDLTVYKDGWPILWIPAGIGKSETPTPLGSFFVAVIERPGPKGYGPVVLDTSGHSEAIQSWEGTGDAVIAIHGPISKKSDQQIGSSGTYISNGCIRLHEYHQVQLDQIPLGTPVDITN